MRLVNKNILLISPEPWDHLQVSKHHYAKSLAAKGNKVFFLNPPSANNKCTITDNPNLNSVEYTGFIRGLRFLPGFIQKQLINRKFKELQRLCNVKFDIIWSFDNSVFFDFSALPKNVLSISHIVDLNQDFQFKKAALTAHLCLCTTNKLKEKLSLYNSNVFLINHGYAICESGQVQLPGSNTIKTFYAGNLDIPYIDWSLVEDIVKTNRDVDFIMAGKWQRPLQSLFELKNFFYLGILQAANLHQHYSGADILMICYLYNQYPDQLANPHKMMEYLGSGKVVVATWTEEYRNLAEKDLILMSKNQNDFQCKFRYAVENLENYNDTSNQGARMNFALENTYEKQIERIEKIISSITV